MEDTISYIINLCGGVYPFSAILCFMAGLCLLPFSYSEYKKKKRCTTPVNAKCIDRKLVKTSYGNNTHKCHWEVTYAFTLNGKEYKILDYGYSFQKLRFGRVTLEKPEIGHYREFGINLLNDEEFEYWDLSEHHNSDMYMNLLNIVASIFLVIAFYCLVRTFC